MSDDREEMMERQERHDFHSTNLARQGTDDKQPQTLKYISEPGDLESPHDALEWINSKTTSTANLEGEDIRSKEWVLEYFQLLARMEHPPEYGLTGHLRAWAYGDVDEYEKPMESQARLEFEGFTESGKEASTKSKEGWGVETATRDTKESIVKGQDKNSSGGLLGRFRS